MQTRGDSYFLSPSLSVQVENNASLETICFHEECEVGGRQSKAEAGVRGQGAVPGLTS